MGVMVQMEEYTQYEKQMDDEQILYAALQETVTNMLTQHSCQSERVVSLVQEIDKRNEMIKYLSKHIHRLANKA